jgi:hypothetical protein
MLSSEQTVARFIVPPGGTGFQYALIETNGQRRWLRLEDSYACDPGGRLEIKLTTAIAADGTVSGEAQYTAQGCRTKLLEEVAPEKPLRLDNHGPPPIPCCSNGPKQWWEE